MTRSDTLERLCSRISAASGEDPVGSAPSWSSCLFLEVEKPWVADLAESRYFPQGVSAALDRANDNGADVRLQGLEPDEKRSVPDHHRLIYYERPGDQFASYAKHEYVAPKEQTVQLVGALLERRDELDRFAEFRRDTDDVRDIFVCTHGAQDTCCGSFGYSTFEALHNDYASQSGGKMRAWRTSHTGGHRLAPNLIDMPEGRYWARVVPDKIGAVIHRDGPTSDLKMNYRGWTGLRTPYEKVAEREVMAREGWGWTALPKSGEVLSQSADSTRAEVRLDYVATDGRARAYEATVELQGTVMKANCMQPSGPAEIPQYAVVRLDSVS